MADDIHQQLPLRARLGTALETAQTEDRESVESATLRLILCAVDDRDVSARERGECGGCQESELVALLETMAKQRTTSAKEYIDAGRIEEAEREEAELTVIETYLPNTIRGQALDAIVAIAINDLEATKLKDMGRCMHLLKQRFPGQIDTGATMRALREALG